MVVRFVEECTRGTNRYRVINKIRGHDKMEWMNDEYPHAIYVDGRMYHHVTGFLEASKHRENLPFSMAIREELSASIAREMGAQKIMWADVEFGKRELTNAEILRYERDKSELYQKALDIKFSDPRLRHKLMHLTDSEVPDHLRAIRDRLLAHEDV